MGIVAKLGIKTSIFLSLIAALAGCGGGPAGSSGGGVVADGAGGQVKIGDRGGQSFSEGSATSELLRVNSADATWEIGIVVVDGNNFAVNEEFDVTFSSSCVDSGLALIDGEALPRTVTTLAGRASVEYNSGQCDSVDSVVATLTSGLSLLRASVDLDIDAAIRGVEDGDISAPLSVRIGNGIGDAFVEDVLLAGSTSLQAGASTLISVNVVDTSGAPFTDSVGITFSSSCVSQGLASFDQASSQTEGGLATATYVSSGCSGEDIVEARATVNQTALRAQVTLNIAPDNVLSVRFLSTTQPSLAIRGIGGVETTDVFFRAEGAQGAPIVGETISFELLNMAGGASLAPGSEEGVTDSTGTVRTVVQSGTVNLSTKVRATHEASGNRGDSEDIIVSTGSPVRKSFDLDFSPHNPTAANSNGAQVTVTVNASDQYGNKPADGTRVSFRSVEVGLIESDCELINGECSVTWSSSGDRSAITPDILGRGYRATVIAFMTGAEDFTDVNGNGLFDIGLPEEEASVVNIGEPYVDQNENDQYDVGEDFVDSFLNNPEPSEGVQGGVNEQYDGPMDSVYSIYNGPCSTIVNSDCPPTLLQSTTIWDSIVISLSSEVAVFCARGDLPVSGSTVSGSYPISFSNIVICDENGNSLPFGTQISFSITGNSLSMGGTSSFTIGSNTTEPRLLPRISVDSTSPTATGILTLTITVPGFESQVLGTWDIEGA